MTRFIQSLAACAALICAVESAAGDDPVDKKLATAKEEFEKATEKARAGLLAELKKKESAAQKAGDLDMLERAKAEFKAFENNGELPKLVPINGYESQLRVARVRMAESYSVAIKEYTMDGKVALAKAIQQELDEFKRGGSGWKQRFPVGEYACTYSGGGKATTELRADGTFRRVRAFGPNPTSEGKLEFNNGRLILKGGKEFAEVWFVEGDEIRLKHWFPASIYPASQPKETGKVTRTRS
jgi:hypothetical protein